MTKRHQLMRGTPLFVGFLGVVLAVSVFCAQTVSAAPTLTTSIVSGDPAVPNDVFTVQITLSENSAPYTIASIFSKVSFDSRKVDLVGAAFVPGGFIGSEGPTIIPSPSDPVTTPGINASRQVAAADLTATATNTMINGPVLLLTFRTTSWTAAPLGIAIGDPGVVRPGGAPAEPLIIQDNSLAYPFVVVAPVYDNSATTGVGAPDTDKDGKPDVCESSTPGAADTNLLLPDSDGDGLLDSEEAPGACTNHPNAIVMTDPRKKDTDGDTIPDAIEIRFLHTDPLSASDPAPGSFVDADGDGVPASIDPDDTKADTDGDFYSDWYEMAHGFSPTDAASFPGLGDVNDSKTVTNVDILKLKQYVAIKNPTGTIVPANMDVNLNGTITNTDILRLKQYVGKTAGKTILP